MSQDRTGFAEHTDGYEPILLTWSEDGTVLSVAGELDLMAASALRETLSLRDVPREGRVFRLDLSGVTFVDCSGWEPVAEAAARMRERGGSVEVVAASDSVMRLLSLIDPGPVEVGDAHAYG